MSAARCKIIIDSGARVAGTGTCVAGSIPLFAALGIEATEDEYKRYKLAVEALETATHTMLDRMAVDATLLDSSG